MFFKSVSVCELFWDGPTSPCVSDETFVTFLLALFLSFCLFSPHVHQEIRCSHTQNETRRGEKIPQCIILPEKASGEKEQAREEERGGESRERASFCHLFTGMAMSNCVTVINEWVFCGGVRNLPWIRGPSKWMVYFFCLRTPPFLNGYLNEYSLDRYLDTFWLITATAPILLIWHILL